MTPYSVIIKEASSEADGYKNRVVQPDGMKKRRELGKVSPKWAISIRSLSSELREPRRRDVKNVRARGGGESNVHVNS